MLRNDRNNIMDDLIYITEKKTREQYSKEKWKKDHKFVPDKTKGGNDPNRGTFDRGDGVRKKVDMAKTKTVSTKNLNDDDIDVERMTMHSQPNDTYYLDKNFHKLKNKKRKEAILQHEVGHDKYHNISKQAPGQDKSTVSNEAFNTTVLSLLNSSGVDEILKGLGFSDSDIKNQKKDVLSALKPKRNKYISTKDNSQIDKALLRKDLLKLLRERSSNQPHDNAMEKEADLHAVNKTSAKDLKKGMQEYSKKAAKDRNKIIDKAKGKVDNATKKEYDKAKKQNNQVYEQDLKSRTKVLNDKEIREKAKKIYK